MTMNFPTINLVATGQNIVRLRKAAGLSVKDLQDIFGFATPQAIYKWMAGRSLPSLDNLIILSRILHISMEDILVVDGDVVFCAIMLSCGRRACMSAHLTANATSDRVSLSDIGF